jgi:two-component system, chemotaxis family, sensor kinase CheA
MSRMLDQADVDAHLRTQIDELSTTLLVSGPSAAVIAGLRQLSEAALQNGRADVAAAAGELVDRAAKAEASVKEDILRDGLSAFQNILSASSPAEPAEIPLSTNPLAQDPELVGDFVTESREHLSSIEKHLLTLEQNPEEMEAVHAVFRGFHTIKGLAGFLDFMPIRDVAHEVETLLDLARNGKTRITGALIDTVLGSVDYLKQSIEAVEQSMSGQAASSVGSNAVLIEKIQKLIRGEEIVFELDDPDGPALAKLGEVLTSASNIQKPEIQVPETPATETSKIPDGAALESVTREASSNVAAKGRSAEAASVRVQTSKLDYLMDMVGEMVITQSLIRHSPALSSIQNSKLLADLSQLSRITSEVQRTTMGMRMITIGQVFQRSTRLVRDLSRKAGKQVQLDISGEETELDKTIAEELTDPLLHMVRNSCDHGVEEPAVRIAAGKNPTARIRLAAYHQGGQIVVEISDDGRGLDREKILAKAIQRGLIEPGAHLSEQEIFNLIFEPGFSTAAQITDLSGRGVGMDVVRKNIQKLRGRIEIQSKAGHGTTFLLKLPLTLAIIEGLVVAVGDHRYIVPIYAVCELINPKPESISTVHGRNEMAMVRDRVLPIVRLARRFNVIPKSEDPCKGLLVVTESQEQLFCLFVDEVLGKQEVVIKSLGDTLKNIPGIAGGAILGDGRVGLILELDGVFRG